MARLATGAFSFAAFRAIWLLGFVANICLMTQTVVTAWLMTHFGSATLVALVQTAFSTPILVFALASGTMADVAARSRMLLAAFAVMAASALTMGLVSLIQTPPPLLLLGTAFLFGSGMALLGPPALASIGDVIPAETLPEAVATYGIGYNLARCIGPALGGAVLAVGGAEAAYAINAFCAAAMFLLVLMRLHARRVTPANPQHPWHAFAEAAALPLRSGSTRLILLRAALHAATSSAVWALAPILAKQQLHGGAGDYGLLMGAIGLGAILFAFAMRRLRDRIGLQGVAQMFTLVAALAMLALPFASSLPAAILMMLGFGASWTAVMTVWSVASQLCLPRRLAGRGVGLFHSAMFGGLAAGSLIWGRLTETHGLTTALVAAGMIAALSLGIGARWPVPDTVRQA